MKTAWTFAAAAAVLLLGSPGVGQAKMPLPKCFRSESDRSSFVEQLRSEVVRISRAQSASRDRATRDELELEWRELDAEIPQAHYVPICPPPANSPASVIRNTPFGDDPPPVVKRPPKGPYRPTD